MAKKGTIIALTLAIISLLVSPSSSFHNYANRDKDGTWIPYTQENIDQGVFEGGHDTLVVEGMNLKVEVHKNDPDGGDKFRQWADPQGEVLRLFRTGAHDEDTNKYVDFLSPDPPIGPNGWGDYFHHFYNPNTEEGLKGLAGSAPTRAGDYARQIGRKIGCKDLSKISPQDKSKIYDSFGRILHLLQDMGNPAHTNDDIHVFTATFEDYVRDNWANIVQSDSFKQAITPEEYRKWNFDSINPLSPESLLKNFASFSSSYPTDGLGKLSDEQVKDLARDLIPMNIQMTAGYIDSVYKLMSSPVGPDCKSLPPDPNSPAGDHPDDRFDVADEFYWETEHQLSNAELTRLFLRTAIKKGKIGVWYKDQFIQTFFEGRAQYKDAPQEVKDAIEARFQAIKAKLEQRKNQIESDWKGAPDVALLTNGFYDPSISLMLKIGEPVSFQKVDFNPEIVKDHPVLLVPTGGFYGLEKSSYVKAMLEEYVKKGGTLVVFTQQHGYDWDLLPVPENPVTGEKRPVKGYGYQEDQSCTFNSVYIDTYHPVLSFFSTATASIGVDGYFTSYPEGSTILLRRTANKQPAMILYPYGQGQVIATALYTDFAFSHSQANQAELNFVHNIISWAKKPIPLPEIKPGETVNLNVNLSNFMDIPATAAKFIFLDPRRRVISEETINISMAAGQTLSFPISYSTAVNSPLGIYQVDYTLLDPGGGIIQPQAETDSGRFVVSNPSENPYQNPDFNFSIQSEAERYLYGTPATFTVSGWNNTDRDAYINFQYMLSHLGPGGSYLGGSRQFNIPAKGTASFNIIAPDVCHEGYLTGIFYDESGKAVGSANKGVWMVFPSVNINLQADKNLYLKGDSVSINTLLNNNQNIPWQPDVKIAILNSRNSKVFEEAKTVSLSPGVNNLITSTFPLGPTLDLGSYIVGIELWYGGRLFFSKFTTIELVESQISVIPNFPPEFSSGTSPVPFVLTNRGKIGVASGVLDIRVRSPGGSEVYSGTQSFYLGVGESKTVDMPLSFPPLEFGSYQIIYSQSDETKTGIPAEIPLSCNSIISLLLDKNTYQVRETAILSGNLTNSGKFNLGETLLTVSAPSANYINTTTINLGPEQSIPLQFAIPIPEGIVAGQHDVIITLTLPGGASKTQISKFTVLGSSLTISYLGPESLVAGNMVSLIVENKGGLDAPVECQVILTGNGEIVYQSKTNDLIQAGTSKSYNFPIPTQATKGPYVVRADVLNTKTNEKKTLWQDLDVTGIKAGLSLWTDRDVYSYGDNVTAFGKIVNQGDEIESASLHLQVVNRCHEMTSYHFSIWDGGTWVERAVIHYANNMETKLIDLSPYLPDGAGEYKVRIRHAGVDKARIDYISLLVDGAFYTPYFAQDVDNPEYNMLYEIQNADNQAADVLNNEVEIRWQGVPLTAATAPKVLLMEAQEGWVSYSCRKYTYWQTDIPIDQAANAVTDLSRQVTNLNNCGQFFLEGTLLSRTGQVIAQAQYPFNIISGTIALRFSPEKPVYRPGETLKITGEVINVGGAGAPDLTLQLGNYYGEPFHSEPFSIPANGRYPFIFTTAAGLEGVYQISGAVYHGDDQLVLIREKYEVANPDLLATVSGPAVAGHGPFQLGLYIDNSGKTPADIQVVAQGGSLSDTQALNIPAGEAKHILYTPSITADTIFAFNITGDLNQTITFPVGFGEGANFVLNAQAIYLEGRVEVPLTVNNTGQMEQRVEVKVELQQGAGIIQQQNKTYILPPGASIVEVLSFTLSEGDYQVRASSQVPLAGAQANFAVRKERKVEAAVSVGTMAEGLVPVTANFANHGYNTLNGNVYCSVQNSENAVLWSGRQTMGDLASQTSKGLVFNINPAVFPSGVHTIKTEFFGNDGLLIASSISPLTINGPNFEITQVPPDQTFTAGQEATFPFRIRNTGDQEGEVALRFKAYDLIDMTKQEWLKAGEEKEFNYGFLLPDDLEEKDYFATYELKNSRDQGLEGSRGQVKYHLAGINIAVSASLDKPNYQEGETAQLTLVVSSPNAQPSAPKLFARVNYPGYEMSEQFVLNGSQNISFDVPLTKISGEKLFFGVYHETGRSIHLNSLYVYKAGDVLTITTDKQVYKPGETVFISVSAAGNISGLLTLTAPNFEETAPFNDTATGSFQLPSVMDAGTYQISYQLAAAGGQAYTGNHPFDVDGVLVKVKEATLDKAKYESSDTIKLNLTIETNQDIGATLKTWLVDPDKNYKLTGTQAISLNPSGLILATQSVVLNTEKLGVHRLIYGLYAGDILLCAGTEALDIGGAGVLGVSTDLTDYPTSDEPVMATVRLFGNGPATLELFLDGQSTLSREFFLAGFSTFQYSFSSLPPGRHTIKATLTSSNLTSKKETTFLNGSNLADLTVRIAADEAVVGSKTKLTLSVTNKGKSPSSPTDLYLYDGTVAGGLRLTTFAVKGLAPGEYQVFPYEFDCQGRAGVNTVSAWIDPEGRVSEFNKSNNEVQTAFTVPELSLETVLGKEVYPPGETIIITGRITNLSSGPVSEFILSTEVMDAAGLQVFANSVNMQPIGESATITVDIPWVTGSLPEGSYTISQTLQGMGVLTTKVIALRADQDFSIASQAIHQKVEKGEAVQYILDLTPVRDFTGEVSLSIEDCPPGFIASFFPNRVSLAGGSAQSILKMTPTGLEASGSYGMRVNAAGGGRNHSLALGLDLTDFRLAITPVAQDIKQLDGAVYTIILEPLYGFDDVVTVEVNGMPKGMQASLGASEVALPRRITLTLTTSKWLLPGVYPFNVSARGKVLYHAATATLMVDKNPAITPGIVTAPGPMNKPIINSFQADGVLLNQFKPFDYKSSTRIATGDVDGDGVDEVIAGMGWIMGRPPSSVRIFKMGGAPVALMETGQRNGLTVAAGDFDGDWIEEVAVGSYQYNTNRWGEIIGYLDEWLSWIVWDEDEFCRRYPFWGRGVVKVYKISGKEFIDTGLVLYPYEAEGYLGTPNVAIGDVDGDGIPELITAPGPDVFAPARIKVFRIDISGGMGRWKVASQMADITVPFERKRGYEPWMYGYIDGYGANVAAGDLDRDGRAEIIVGAGPHPRKSSKVVILKNVDGLYTTQSFIAYEGSGYGVTVAAADIDGDGRAEILTGRGPGPWNKSTVKIFRGDGTLLEEFQAYPDSVPYGVRVSGGGVGEVGVDAFP